MSGPGRPTLYKPEHASRARELAASRRPRPIADLTSNFRVLINDHYPSVRSFAVSPKGCTPCSPSKTRGGKGGNLQFFGNSGLFDDGATRRKPAETGGNWRKPL
jgi:hypothetical protein